MTAGRGWNSPPARREPVSRQEKPARCGCGGMFPLHRHTILGVTVKMCAECDRVVRHGGHPDWLPTPAGGR